MDRFDPFVKYADVYGDIINWEKDPMNKPQNQNKYFFSDGKTYYEQICKMLRLMSVFKEAFNQIYSNEDEISEAWENFVNNLSASVVEGSEPDVTLTWTDDSVNFEFTMVPGVPGEQGVGITSISFNSDYTMTITLSDGNTYTSMSLKGDTGPQGPQGETGSGLQILDVYATLADLQSAHPTGQPGDAYQVGSAGNYTLYIWSSSQSAWVQAGTLGTVSPSVSNPLMDGTASAGSLNQYSRGDHVHPSDTSRASKEELDALIKTSQALIDQSFTYRESPAIQDGLARIDKIKGNTLVWNQQLLAPTVSASATASADGSYRSNRCTFTYDSSTHIITITSLENVGTSGFVFGLVNGAPLVNGHKYLQMCDVQAPKTFNFTIGRSGDTDAKTGLSANTYHHVSTIKEFVPGTNEFLFNFNSNNAWEGTETVYIKNAMLFDLTEMGLSSITDPDDFIKLFPLSYYDYDTESLLSFNGTGLKTVGANLILFADGTRTGTGITGTVTDGVFSASGTATSTYANLNYFNELKVKNGEVYTVGLNKDLNYGITFRFATDTTDLTFQQVTIPAGLQIVRFTANNNYNYVRLYISGITSGTAVSFDGMVPMIAHADLNVFKPYIESNMSLPIATYFPTGMKNARNAYDELIPTKAITRISRVDLGTLTWERTTTQGGDYKFFSSGISSLIKKPNTLNDVANIICSKYQAERGNGPNAQEVGVGIHTNGNILIYDTAYASATAEEFKSAMSGVYLYYELATPTETAIDIDLDFIAYEDGTEQLLPVNGSVPSTSPIIADMTYLSIDDAMEYVLEKLANVPQNTQQILESLEDDVADLQTDVGALQPAVSGLQTSVGNINTNIGQLSSTVAGHTASISGMQSDISDLNTGLGNLEDTVTDNTSRIGTLETGLTTTNGNVQNLETSVSDLDDTVTAQGTTVTALDSIIQDISNNPVVGSLGSHELGFVAAYVSATLAANTGTKVTIPKPTIFPNNYTPLFIVGMTTGSYNVSICEIPYTFGTRDSVDCRVWNHGGQQTTQITVYILCMRQRQSQ